MITIKKTILGLSALAFASVGAYAYTATEPASAHRAPAPAITANGKVADRLPTQLSGEQIANRIRSAHGLPTQVASVDCKAYAWPNIPTECLTSTDGSPVRRPVRVISTDARSATPATAALARQPETRTIRN